MKTKIYTRKNENGTDMILRGHDRNGKEIWVTVEYYERKFNKQKNKSIFINNPV